MTRTGKISRAAQGAATRAAILDAARQRFAAEGYERATIRAIAGDAGIDPSLVIRYYGSKQELFLAVAELDLKLPDLTQVKRADAGATLIRHLFELWESNDVFTVLLRTATSNAEAAARIRRIALEQVVPMVASVCKDTRSLTLRANLISTQMLGFAYGRYVLALPALTAMRSTEAAAWLGPTIQRYLFSPVPGSRNRGKQS